MNNIDLFTAVLHSIKPGDIVASSQFNGEKAYWEVLTVDYHSDTIAVHEVHQNPETKEYVPVSVYEAAVWMPIERLLLEETCILNNYMIGFTYSNDTEDDDHNRDVELYHITYSLDFAKGMSLKHISPSSIITIEGIIISKGVTWVIETTRGTVIIPFASIIHMHPQY